MAYTLGISANAEAVSRTTNSTLSALRAAIGAFAGVPSAAVLNLALELAPSSVELAPISRELTPTSRELA